MPGDSAEISVEAADTIQVGGLDKSPMIVPIPSPFCEWQSYVAVTRAERTSKYCVESRASGFLNMYERVHRRSPCDMPLQ
jgi:hypothetical protein